MGKPLLGRRLPPRLIVGASLTLFFGIVVPSFVFVIRSLYFPNLFYRDDALHALIEASGATLAIVSGIILCMIARLQSRREYAWAAASLLSMGILSSLHAAFTREGNEFVWLEASSNLLGAFFALGTCFPEKWQRPVTSFRSLDAVAWFATALSLSWGIVSLNWPHSLPNVSEGDRFTFVTHWLGLCSSICFLPPAVHFLRRYLSEARTKDLLLANLFLLSGSSAFIPRLFHVWGMVWWAWHYIQLGAFACACCILFVRFWRMELHLKQLNDELARSNEALENFAALACHDLKEPLRTTSSYVAFLARKYRGKLEPDADEFIGFALDGTRRMRDIVDGLYELISARNAEHLHFEWVDLNVLLKEMIHDLKEQIADSHAQIMVQPDLPPIYADRRLLRVVFQNLVSNALKFRKEGEVPKIAILMESSRSGWSLSVEDNGIGFDPRHEHRIFELFQRLHGRSEYPGAGIGLALCKTIVEKHGGEIRVRSGLGRGTRFTFTIPNSQHAIQPVATR